MRRPCASTIAFMLASFLMGMAGALQGLKVGAVTPACELSLAFVGCHFKTISNWPSPSRSAGAPSLAS